MKFIDQATITVRAGSGGHGCLSFRREKFVAKGGPDGGDGGDGGSIYLQATESLNTLVSFRYQPHYKAERGGDGSGRQRTGKKGEDLIIPVPVGTLVFDADTNEQIADLTQHEQRVLVAKGGFHGLGNTRFKSSVNRAPRKTSKGTPGDERQLKLELKLLADIGLVGLPNAGKSTLIRAVSAATPKVADYPFTTLTPSLGVVQLDDQRSFVMADIPGIIEGAAEGAGLGIQFLKHIARTSVLLHVLDMTHEDPVKAFEQIENELEAYGHEVIDKPRWLVLNKMDMLPEDQVQARADEIVKVIGWKGPVYVISGIAKKGTKQLVEDLFVPLSLRERG